MANQGTWGGKTIMTPKAVADFHSECVKKPDLVLHFDTEFCKGGVNKMPATYYGWGGFGGS